MIVVFLIRKDPDTFFFRVDISFDDLKNCKVSGVRNVYEGSYPGLKLQFSSFIHYSIEYSEIIKNIKILSAINSFSRRYSHFTGVLAYGIVPTKNFNDDIST